MHDNTTANVRRVEDGGDDAERMYDGPSLRSRSMEEDAGQLSRVGMGMSVVVACLVFVGLMPCLGWINWFALLLGGIGNILCWVGVFTEGQRSPTARRRAVTGLVVTFIALFVGGIRLVLGAGVL